MIERGSEGKLHTSSCSAAHHHRTSNLGAICLWRCLWTVVPTWLRIACYLTLFGALTFVSWLAVQILFVGI